RRSRPLLALHSFPTRRSSDLAGVSVVLLAPRRTGKSSLVLRVLDQLHEHHVLTAYADLQRTPSKVRFASHLAHAIHDGLLGPGEDRKSTRLNSSHLVISYAVF